MIREFYGKNRKIRPETFQTTNDPFWKFRKKIFPATQNSALGNSLRVVIFSFLLTISRPPGVCQNKKTPSHFIESCPHNPARTSPDPRSATPVHTIPVP